MNKILLTLICCILLMQSALAGVGPDNRSSDKELRSKNIGTDWSAVKADISRFVMFQSEGNEKLPWDSLLFVVLLLGVGYAAKRIYKNKDVKIPATVPVQGTFDFAGKQKEKNTDRKKEKMKNSGFKKLRRVAALVILLLLVVGTVSALGQQPPGSPPNAAQSTLLKSGSSPPPNTIPVDGWEGLLFMWMGVLVMSMIHDTYLKDMANRLIPPMVIVPLLVILMDMFDTSDTVYNIALITLAIMVIGEMLYKYTGELKQSRLLIRY